MTQSGTDNSTAEPPLTPQVNYGLAAQDYARWRQGFPDEFFHRLVESNVGIAGQNILDIGTGTGLLGRGFALRGCMVTGLDASPELIEQAKKLDEAQGLSTQYYHARAENTGLTSASYDVISAGTCWHWLDRPKVALECLRLLKPGGKLVISHLDWLNLPGNVIDITLQTIRRFNPVPLDKPITFQYPDWLIELTQAGFKSYEIFGSSIVMNYTQEAWRGRIRASKAVGPEMSPETLKLFDEDFKQALAKHFPDDMLKVDQKILTVILQSDQ